MMLHNINSSSSYMNIKRGTYDINGKQIFFRSKWEANYALYLDFLKRKGVVADWDFEPTTFMYDAVKRGTRSYTPDFYIENIDGTHEYHEVKGYMDSKSRTKIKRFAKYYPDEKLILIQRDIYMAICKQVGSMLNFY